MTRTVLLGIAAVVTVVVVALGALLGDPGAPGPSEPPPVRSLAELETTGLEFPRSSFCDRLSDELVERALGGQVAATAHYDNGESATLAPGVEEVAHEFGCGYAAGDGTTARAWVFVPPVTSDRAEALAAAVAGSPGEGCQIVEAAPLGTPSVATLCQADGAVTATYAGLLGDAWLSCSLALPAPPAGDPLEPAGRWCADVVRSVGG